jgi:hypothetical protein
MKRQVIIAMPILFCIVILIYLWVKFETLAIEEAAQIGPTTVYKELIHTSEAFEVPSVIYFTSTNELKFEGQQSAFIAKDNLYGVTYISDASELLRASDLLDVSFMLYAKHPVTTVKFGFSVGDAKENLIFCAVPVEALNDTLTWVKRTLFIPIDKRLLKKDIKLQLRSYILNEGKEEFYIDNLDIKIKAVQL